MLGIPRAALLNRVVSVDLQVIEPGTTGLTLSGGLARKLGVGVGDRLRLEATDGRRITTEVTVVGIVQPFLGSAAYMEREALGPSCANRHESILPICSSTPRNVIG